MLCVCSSAYLSFFFFNDTSTTEIYTLSLHDALPIWLFVLVIVRVPAESARMVPWLISAAPELPIWAVSPRNTIPGLRSEEHTSELQSQSNLVCRLLLEKKKRTRTRTTRA